MELSPQTEKTSAEAPARGLEDLSHRDLVALCRRMRSALSAARPAVLFAANAPDTTAHQRAHRGRVLAEMSAILAEAEGSDA